jgi:predicted dehydrogenase
MASTIATELAALRDEGHELVAVASRRRQTAADFAARHGIPYAIEGYDALACDGRVDAVYVATPHVLHCSNMLACLAGGKAVLCEKPFTINASQASAVIEQARRRRIFVMEAMWTRFLPAIRALRDLLRADAIGRVRMVIGGGAFMPERKPGYYLFDHDLGGGVLLDAGVYLISMASMVLGTPIKVLAAGAIGETGVDEQTAVTLETAEQATALLYVSLRARRPPDLEILGERGRIRVEAPVFRPAALTVWGADGAATVHSHPIDGSGYGGQLREVAAALRQGRTESAIMPLDETLSIMRTMDAVRAQIGLQYPGEEPAG